MPVPTTTTPHITEHDLLAIHDQSSLYAFLRGKLQWPVDPEDTFTYDGPKLAGSVADRAEVTQIVPFSGADPFTIFLVEFETQFRRGDLREILRAIRERIRNAGKYNGRSLDELIFICVTSDYGAIRIAHFEERPGRSPSVEVFGWDKAHIRETRTLRDINLPSLTMPGRNLLEEYDWSEARGKWLQAWNVRAITNGFFRDYQQVYGELLALITRVPSEDDKAKQAKQLFIQRLLNRLLFIQFLSKRGWMLFRGRSDYLPALWESRLADEKFYNARLRTLFFAGLNNPACRDLRKTDSALFELIGEMPFLNGGLFEDAPEDRDTATEPGAIVPNEAVEKVIKLFEKYNFTITESAPDDVEVAVDPEMLGEVFERIVNEGERKTTGSYYTPRSIVQFMCREALKGYLGGYETLVDERKAGSYSANEARQLIQRLGRVRVLDPACGSGAYLLGMLHELFDLTGLLEVRANPLTAADEYRRKLDIIQNNLYGVDLTGFAVETARMRLWLSLVVEDRRNPLQDGSDVALPNLDYKVEEGDSLTAPNPRDTTAHLGRSEDVEAFVNLKNRYFSAHGQEKKALKNEVERMRLDRKTGNGAFAAISGFDWAAEFGEVFKPDQPGGDSKGFDIVLANPPYGASVEDRVRDLYFDRRSDGPQSKDTYGLFVARAMQLLHPGGQFCFIVSDTWRTIKSHKPLRRRLVEQATISHVLDLPSWVFDGATVNTCILTFVLGAPPENHKLIAGDLRSIPNGDWAALELNLRSAAAHGVDVQTTTYARYTYPQRFVATYDNYSIFIGLPSVYRLMSERRFHTFGSTSDVKQGLATGDNDYYIRKRLGARGSYEILNESLLLRNEEVAHLTSDEKINGIDPINYGGRHFVSYDKGGESNAQGGWLPNYYVPTAYFIDWSATAVRRMKTTTSAKQGGKVGARFQNSQYYFVSGLTWSDVGVYSPTFRYSGNAVFDVKGSRIISNRLSNELGLAILCSIFARYVMKNLINHTVSTQVDDVRGMLLPSDLDKLSTATANLINLVNDIVVKQGNDHFYPYFNNEQRRIDKYIYELYGLDSDDIREIELWYCRRYQRLAEAQGVLAEVKQKYADHLAHAELIMSKPPGYWRSHPLLTEIARDETATQEFKEFLDYNSQTGTKDAEAVKQVLAAIASFANTDGGTVLIGVANDLSIPGIARDLTHVNRQNADGFQDKLRGLIADKLGAPMIGKAEITFETLPDATVCRVKVQSVPKKDIVYLDRAVYIRDNNGKRKLEGQNLVHWSQERARQDAGDR